MASYSLQGSPPAPTRPVGRTALPPYSKSQRIYDVVFRLLCRGSALLVIGLMVLLIAVLLYESIPAFKAFGAKFLITNEWDPQGKLGAL